MQSARSRRFFASSVLLLAVGLGFGLRESHASHAHRARALAAGPAFDDARSLRVATLSALTARADASYRFVEERDGVHATNREGGFDVNVSPRGDVAIASHGRAPTSFSFRGIARAGASAATGRTSELPRTIDGSHLALDHGAGIVEWYRNGPLGLEQGFDLASRPAGEGAFSLEIEAHGARVVAHEGTAAALVAPDGTSLRYDELHVTDADGRFLASRLEARGDLLAIVVDDTGARYPVRVDPIVVPFEGTLQANAPVAGDALGTSVDVEGNVAVVGAPMRAAEGNSEGGTALVFVRSGTTWAFLQEIDASDPTQAGHFGTSVAIHGSTIVVGAPGARAALLPLGAIVGAAYVFQKTGSAATPWTFSTKLTASDAADGAEFGTAVAIDGTDVVVGAPAASGAVTGSGAAYYFTLNLSLLYLQFAKLVATDGASGDRFGASVSSTGGKTVLVGAPADDLAGNNTTDAGSAYVFTRGSTTYTQTAKLTALDAAGGDAFGTSVAIAGTDAIVGSPKNDNIRGSDAGAVYLFATNSPTSWAQQRKLFGRNAHGGDLLGTSVDLAVAANGALAVAGAPGTKVDTGNAPGIGYVFVRSGVWFEAGSTALTSVVSGGLLGSSIAADADTIVVGAPLDTANNAQKAGTARVFRMSTYRVLAVDLQGAGTGTVASAPVGIACTPDCIAAFPLGNVVTLTPTPAAGSYFAGWSGDCTGLTPCAPTMTANHAVTAIFELQKPAGAACMNAPECVSGSCVDGVCCGTACGVTTLDCVACSIAAGGTVDGQCTPVVCVDDGDPCTAEACTDGVGCTHVPVPGCVPDGGVADGGLADGSVTDGSVTDGSSGDSGTSVDAGPPPITFTGQGGCSCSAVPSEAPAPWLALASLGWVIAARRRRARASRGR